LSTKTDPRVKELRDALQTKAAEIDGLASAWKTEDGGKLVISTDQHKAYKSAVTEAEQIKELLTDAEKAAGLREFMGAPAHTPAAALDAVTSSSVESEAKTLGDYFLDSDQYRQEKSSPRPYINFTVDRSVFELRAAAQHKDVYAGTGGSVNIGTIGGVQALPMREMRLRQKHVRDLFPSATTTAAVLYGVRETGYTNSARAVPQRENADGTANSSGAEYASTGVVLHPLDWEALELEETDTGEYRIAMSVAVGAEKRVWTMDVVSTTAMTQNNYLLGAFGLGAMYYDRETVSVTVSTENKDNYERNVVTFRAESRGALEVMRPESFVAGTFTTPA
jgi:hypothetical protein